MSYSSEVLADSPWGYWDTTETSGTALADSSGNARTLTTSGGPTLAQTGPAATADAISWPASTASATTSAKQATSAATHEFWVYVSAYPAARTVLQGCTAGAVGASASHDKSVYLGTDGRLVWYVYTGTEKQLVATNPLSLNAWHHVVASVGAAGQKLRVDKVAAATTDATVTSSFTGATQFLTVRGSGSTVGVTSIVGTGAVLLARHAFYTTQLSDARADAHFDALSSTTPALTAAPTSTGVASAAILAVGLVAAAASSVGLASATSQATFEITAASTGTGSASAEVSIIATTDANASTVGFASAFIAGGDLLADATSTGSATADVERAPATSVGPVRGRARVGAGVAKWTPPVAPRPAHLEAPRHARVAAHSYTGVTMRTVAGITRPVLRERRTAERHRHADRILIAGRDVTYYRGVPTPLPKFGLVEPLLYGSGTLELPQIAAAFENPGRGALTWLKAGAPVLVQRVAVGGSQAGKVVATDYRGIILGFGVSGAGLTLDLGGDALGRASLREKPQPLYRRRRDLGWLWWNALAGTDSLRRPFDKVHGTRTGIALYDTGGTDLNSYLSELAGKGVSTRGAQWTCMPAEGGDRAGVYRVRRKDMTTIHATAYLDDAHTVASLQADAAEQPNRIYGTGVTPTGERAKFGVYPMLAITGAAPFPNNVSGQPMRRGDTDADTDTGGGISALLYRLSVTGYLDIRGLTGGFSADAARAVRDLQDDADLPATGRVDRATWAALYDHDVVGYSSKGARIEPIAQLSKVRRLRRNASGQVIGVNPNFDPAALVIDATKDFGTGVTRAQMRDWARHELHTTRHWVGTITLELGAVIRGHHHPGDPLGANDLMHARALRPGQNLWLPLWDGGTLLHISGVDVDDQRVILAVDTRARDTMTVWEVIARNQDNKRSPWRAWVRDHRSSAMSKDAVLEFDEVGGVITPQALGVGWNVFPVVAGQEGTIGRLRLELDRPAEYAVAVFGRRMGPNRLAQLIGNPLSHEGAKRWADPDRLDTLVGDHGLVYSAGDDQAPCGYFPGTKETRTYTPQIPNPKYNIDVSPNSDKFDNRETLNEQVPNPAYDPTDPDNDQELIDRVVTEVTTPVTGRWSDDAGFGYRTYDNAVLWVAIYVRHARTLKGGRIMWPQLEAGS